MGRGPFDKCGMFYLLNAVTCTHRPFARHFNTDVAMPVGGVFRVTNCMLPCDNSPIRMCFWHTLLVVGAFAVEFIYCGLDVRILNFVGLWTPNTSTIFLKYWTLPDRLSFTYMGLIAT